MFSWVVPFHDYGFQLQVLLRAYLPLIQSNWWVWSVPPFGIFWAKSCKAEGSFGVAGRLDSNPGRLREPVKFHVAMSRCTNWPPKLSTNMVIDYCTLNIQPCMIHFCVRCNTLITMIYHSLFYHKCTMSYDHICAQIFACWTAVLPDFFNIANGQIVTKVA